MKLLLHIGTTKTGSKSIQSFLSSNRAKLKDKGYYYPFSLGSSNHYKISAYASNFKNSHDLYRMAGVKNLSSLLFFKASIAREFRKEISSLKKIHTVIISNEHLHSRCKNNKSIKRIIKLLNGLFDEVQIVCYLRPPLDHVISLYSTFLKHGYKKDIDNFVLKRLSASPNYFNYKKYIGLWLKFFNKENIKIKLFDDTRHLKNGVLSDFLETAGIYEHEHVYQYNARKNLSLNPTGQKILQIRNRMRKRKGLRLPIDNKINVIIETEFTGKGILPSPSVAEKFHNSFTEPTEWVKKNWFPNRNDILQPDWDRFKENNFEELAFDQTRFKKIFEKIYKNS